MIKFYFLICFSVGFVMYESKVVSFRGMGGCGSQFAIH